MSVATTAGLIARGILAATFAVAAVAKLQHRSTTRASLRAAGLPESLDRTLPLVEGFTAFGLLMERQTVWAAWVALGLLVLFTGFVAVQLRRPEPAPCPCFGARPSDGATTARTLARNLALTAVALIATVPASSGSGSSYQWVTWLIAGVVTLGLVARARFSSPPAMPNP